MNYAETSYERDDARTDRDDNEDDYRCPHCGEVNGGSVCSKCRDLREKEHSDIEDQFLSCITIGREAHDARWDNDTTQTRKKLAQDLRKEIAAGFFIATGERL